MRNEHCLVISPCPCCLIRQGYVALVPRLGSSLPYLRAKPLSRFCAKAQLYRYNIRIRQSATFSSRAMLFEKHARLFNKIVPEVRHWGLKRRSFATKSHLESLRILFCGSDDFSIASLRKLHKEHQQDNDLIASIDVVCRPGKPVGRGRKIIREGA